MKKHILNNGIKINYIERQGEISSFCIGFGAGAIVEKENELGLAHIVEHMLFKGTENRNEEEINSVCDEIFGFHNAMTNYPYAIYYGTTLSSDFEKGFEIYSDILLNPTFPEYGFREEINIILEELKEWKDDPYQECEDEILKNSFKKRRIKDLIIGTEENISNTNLEDIKNFYKKYYTPENCVISIVSSLPFSRIIDIINKQFCYWKRNNDATIDDEVYEDNMCGIYTKVRKDLSGSKILYCFPIHNLNQREKMLLKIFNYKFGVGTSSILYSVIRTQHGLVYDIGSFIKEEKGIELFMIKLGTAFENINKSLELINKSIEEVKNKNSIFTKENIEKIVKSLNLKRELSIEKSIELCKILTTYEVMFKSTEDIFDEFVDVLNITEDEILATIKKILINPSIQVLSSE